MLNIHVRPSYIIKKQQEKNKNQTEEPNLVQKTGMAVDSLDATLVSGQERTCEKLKSDRKLEEPNLVAKTGMAVNSLDATLVSGQERTCEKLKRELCQRDLVKRGLGALVEDATQMEYGLQPTLPMEPSGVIEDHLSMYLATAAHAAETLYFRGVAHVLLGNRVPAITKFFNNILAVIDVVDGMGDHVVICAFGYYVSTRLRDVEFAVATLKACLPPFRIEWLHGALTSAIMISALGLGGAKKKNGVSPKVLSMVRVIESLLANSGSSKSNSTKRSPVKQAPPSVAKPCKRSNPSKGPAPQKKVSSKLNVHPAVERFVKVAADAFDPSTKGSYVPNSLAKASVKLEPLTRGKISVASNQILVIILIPQMVSDIPSMIYYKGTSTDNISGVNWSRAYVPAMHTIAQVRDEPTLSVRGVACGFKIKNVTSNINLGGSWSRLTAQDHRPLLANVFSEDEAPLDWGTTLGDVMNYIDSNRHTVRHNVHESPVVDFTLVPRSSVGWQGEKTQMTVLTGGVPNTNYLTSCPACPVTVSESDGFNVATLGTDSLDVTGMAGTIMYWQSPYAAEFVWDLVVKYEARSSTLYPVYTPSQAVPEQHAMVHQAIDTASSTHNDTPHVAHHKHVMSTVLKEVVAFGRSKQGGRMASVAASAFIL